MEAYAEYKDSGVDWLGQIPADWDVERAKWLFSRAERDVRANDEIVTCFRDGTVTLRKNRRTDGFTTALKEHGYQGIRRGDLVIHAMDAFAGAIGVSDSDGKSTPVYAACIPRNKKTVDVNFYAYFMRDLALSGFLVSLAKGIRERSTDFRFRDFAELEVSYPTLPEQTAIAAFLDDKVGKVEELVTIKQVQIALLKERKQILIQEAVTKGLNPDAPMQDSGIEWIGQIPAHWTVERGKALFRKVKRPVQQHDGIVTCFRDGEVTLRSNRRVDGFTHAAQEIGYQGIRQGDLVIHAMDAFAGAVGVSDSNGKSSPVYAACIPINPSLVDSYYFALSLRKIALSGLLLSLSKGIRERSTDFRFGDFANLSLAVPNFEEQKQIVEREKLISAEVNAAIAIKENQITKLNEYKVTLINAAVTGKIKVPEQYFSKDVYGGRYGQ